MHHWNHRVAFHVSHYQTPLFTYFDVFLWCLVFSPWNKSKKMNSPIPSPPVKSGITACPVLLLPQHLLMANWRQRIELWGLVGWNQCNCYDPDRCYFSTLIKFVFSGKNIHNKVVGISGGLTVLTLFLLHVFAIVLASTEKGHIGRLLYGVISTFPFFMCLESLCSCIRIPEADWIERHFPGLG